MLRNTGFLHDQRGSMTQTGLVFLLLTLVVGGVSVDVMRQEGTRAEVQQVLDECTMNVAVVEQPGTDSGVLSTAVDACMDRAGIGAALGSVTATSSAGYKAVSATANGTQQNEFMTLVNVNTLGFGGDAAAAVPATAKVEVVLAFESSNAMSAASTTLRAGANAFLDRLMTNDTTGTTSVAVLPYTSGVNLPTALMARYSVTNISAVTNSNCIDLPTADFATAPMLTTTAYKTMTMVDFASSTSTVLTPYVLPTSINGTVGTTSVPCPPYVNNVARTPVNVLATAKGYITSAQFFGGLRWDHAMHWANVLLHPDSNPALAPLLPGAINTRPLAFNGPDLQKVVVFVNKSGTGDNVTDGSTTVLAPAFATGNSIVWRDNSNNYCAYHAGRAGTAKYYVPASNTWVAACTGNGYRVLTWPEVWKSVRATWVAWQLYGRPLAATPTNITSVQAAYTTALASFKQTVTFATQTSQFASECALAKANGVVIFTVALDAVTRAKAPLASCATSPAHSYDTTAAGFAGVMQAIAQTINQQGYAQ